MYSSICIEFRAKQISNSKLFGVFDLFYFIRILIFNICFVPKTYINLDFWIELK